jgi:uncharacterized protein (TIGR02117 family)
MKRFFRYSGIVILTLIGLIMFYGLSAFALSRITVNGDVKSGEDVTIYILTNGVHTDIVVPVKTQEIDWSHYVRHENTIANNTTANLLALGWGNRKFYLETPTWADLKAQTAFEAASGLGSSAMHATFYNSLKESESCKSIKITTIQYHQLTEFVKNSFKLNAGGLPIVIETNANYGKNDAFYEAEGSYSLFHTCNTWANNALKAAEQKASLWTPTDTGIFCHYK